MLTTLFQSGLGPKEIIYYGLIIFFALMLSFSIHEFMHAFVADWLGDSTPRNMGRLTMNPLAHLDPIGTVLLLVAGFGWGKPVMYNPNRLNRFKSPRVMNIMVHLAGVTGNFVLALLSGVIATLITCLGRNVLAGSGAASIALSTIVLAFSYTQTFSLMLLAFNLLPIPPLDGFHVLEELLPYRIRSKEGYRKFEMFSPYAIWVVFILSRLTGLNILSQVISWIELPFALVINGACYLVSLPFG
ncbi:MAG: site-2 protease family protein [Oscillospiraceae bacterium]|nr:site-2 protease family protein [Oscillospiraceae bacterium]